MNESQNEKVLVHHGILGQKWGVRRYQNPDGSLTDAGRKRYGTSENLEKVQEAKRQATTELKARKAQAKADARTAKEVEKYQKKVEKKMPSKKEDKVKEEKPKSKPISEMTDEEIQARIDRLRLEKQLADLQPKQVQKGNEFVDKMKSAAATAVSNASRDILERTIKKKLGDALGLDAKETAKVLDKFEEARRDAEYYQNLNKAAQAKKQLENIDKKDSESKKSDKKEEDKEESKPTYVNTGKNFDQTKSNNNVKEKNLGSSKGETYKDRKSSDPIERVHPDEVEVIPPTTPVSSPELTRLASSGYTFYLEDKRR